jgi:hypothetical protein
MRRRSDPAFRAKGVAAVVACQAKRRDTDPFFKFADSVRRSIRKAFKCCGFRKDAKTAKILGRSPKEFREHIAAQFKPGWTLADQGKKWDLDHIVPISSAKTKKDVIRLNHYANFQPLDCHINRNIKKNRLNWKPGKQ